MSYHIIIATNMRLAEGSPKQSTVTFLAVLCEVLQSPHLVAPASPWTPKHPAQLQLHLPSFTLICLIGILQSCTNFSTDPSRRKQSTLIIQPIGCSHLILWRRVGGWGDQLFQDQVARAELVVSGRLCRLGYRTLQGTMKDIPPEKGKSSTQKCRLLDGTCEISQEGISHHSSVKYWFCRLQLLFGFQIRRKASVSLSVLRLQ